MCMEDVRIGRKEKVRYTYAVMPSSTPVLIAPANASRVGLHIDLLDDSNSLFECHLCDSTGTILLFIQNATVRLPELRIETHGQYVTQDIYAIHQLGASGSYSVLEMILEES